MLNERDKIALLSAVKYAPIDTYRGGYNWSHAKWMLILDDVYHYNRCHINWLLDKLYSYKVDHWNSKIILTLEDVEKMLSVLSC